MPRKKRVLEELPIAPPLPAREPSAAELEAQAQSDARIREYLKFRLGPVIAELRKRNKKFCKPIGDGEEIQIISPVNAEHPVNAAEGQDQAQTEQNGQSGPAVNGINGDAHVHAEQTNAENAGEGDMDTAEGPAAAVPDTTQPMLATTSAETGPEGQMQEQAQLALPMAANPVPQQQQLVFTFRFHDISLDKVHERLFADRYHTPEMMLADIQRIVENAYHEGDPDTLSKADQMLNYARIMCDQACDPAFRIECQRMAQREKERAKKRALAKQKAREEAAAEAKRREDAATQKEAADEAGNKRPREEGDDVDQSEQAKRARFTEDVVMADSPTRPSASSQSLMPPTPAPAGTATTTPSAVPAATEAVGGHSAISEPVAPPPAKEPSPPPAPLPDFILPSAALEELGRFLVSHTGELAVDELEQLRAACYDCIWRARRDWDKTAVIKEIHEMAEDYVSELEASKGE